MKEKVKKTFNELASVYEKAIDTNSIYNSEYERPSMMAQFPEDLNSKRVLDAGCAAGWYTHQLINRGAEVVAVDLSPEMVASAKRRVGNKAEVLCLDLEKALPFESDSFDYIISSLTLHYLQDWNHIFSEFQRVLKPRGIFLFSVHHPMMDSTILEDTKYFSTQLIIDTWNKEGKDYEVAFYRRPLQEIVTKTASFFMLKEMIEPIPTNNFKMRAPESYKKLMKRPNFLIMKAMKDET
ncbi:class I SAM-dependent methyltransferase [Rossellomorea aquimaris]|uniref:Class I SAM-dependent methyltransferase n=1 Tax=Rossellomorea aquimaris TaxID=189382 RepID=A0A5D4TWN6_9BACI|nr:class I SAM-dependent methyltransferase [Rossellomorea aquimaris]TYS79689.1 class I SAM-dependent methyltransferase [Rossellomorea aquimaris]